MPKGSGHAVGGIGDAPRAHPWTDAALQIGDNLLGDARINVDARLLVLPAHSPNLQTEGHDHRDPVTEVRQPEGQGGRASARHCSQAMDDGPKRSEGRQRRCATARLRQDLNPGRDAGEAFAFFVRLPSSLARHGKGPAPDESQP